MGDSVTWPGGNADVEAALGSAGTDPGEVDLAVSIVGRLFRLATQFTDLQELGAREYGMGFARGRVLWALQESGPVVMRALSQRLGISPRTVTGLVDALEADGWVTRSPHPDDRRATIIAITPAAETALATLRENYEGLAHDLLSDLPAEDLARCWSVLATIQARLGDVVASRMAAAGPPPGPWLRGAAGRLPSETLTVETMSEPPWSADGDLLLLHADIPKPTWHRRLWRFVRWVLLLWVILVVVLTVASFGYNLVTSGPAPPPPKGLLMASGGGFDTRYLEWGTTGTPIVLVPGAFETADTFDQLGPVLGRDHRVFAIDLTGTGYSVPSPPYDATHEAAQLLAFLNAKGLTGANGPILVGHSAGAAVAGMAAIDGGTRYVRGVVFLDGDATPLGGPTFLGHLLINPYRTTLLRIALRQDWLVRALYNSQCGPTCPALTSASLRTWVLPLQQPGFADELEYTLQHGIPSMTDAQFAELRQVRVPKLVVYGVDDSQMSVSDAAQTAQHIGAPAPVTVPGRHLTMISSPNQVAAAIDSLDI